MPKKYDTTVLGLVVLDILGRPVSKIPDGGNLAYIDELRLTVAGTAGGTEIDCAKLGVSTLGVGAVGDDEKADFVISTLEKFGVDVSLSIVRRDRMGHIELAAPVSHIWFMKSLPSRIATLLDMTIKNLEKVLYFEQFIVVEPGLTDLKKGEIISEEQYIEYQDEYLSLIHI